MGGALPIPGPQQADRGPDAAAKPEKPVKREIPLELIGKNLCSGLVAFGQQEIAPVAGG